MSRIRRLTIKGVRNFDDETEAPEIRFSRPLTLILGPNGTGKTTIIECLRYVLSGEFPPGADNGKAFVHDPMLKKLPSVEVRGNVKAEILDSRGDQLTITRTMSLTRNQDKLTFKSIDSSITKKDKKTGQKVAHTSRCGDINVEIMSAMGVSKAIVNYVIFCHQDDANWPFETGKNLKERFDAIFETTRYNKALDCIRKLMIDKKSELKGLQGEQQGLKVVVREVKTKQKQLAEFKTKKAEKQKNIEELTNQLRPINERLAKIKEIESECGKWQIENEKNKTQRKEAMKNIQTLKNNIKELYKGSMTELINEIASYDRILSEKNHEIAELECEINDSREKEAKISKIMDERRMEIGKLEQQKQDHTIKVAQRNDTLRNMISAWDLNEFITSDITEADAGELIKKFETKLRQLEQQMDEKRAEQDREQDRLQRKVNDLRAERSTIESQLANNKSELAKIQSDIRAKQTLLSQSGAKEEELNKVDSELDKANKEVDELNKIFEIDGLKRKRTEAIAKEEDLEKKSNRVKEEIDQLQTQSAVHMKLDSCKLELEDKENKMQILREKHGETLKKLLDGENFAEGNMKETVNGAQETLNTRIQNLNKKIETVQYEIMELKTSVKHKEQELEKKEKEIRSDKAKLSVYCKDYNNFSEELLLQSKKLKDLESKRGMWAYQGAAYKEYIKELTEKNPCCPLCHRGFQTQKDALDLVKELRNDISGHPDRLKKFERDLTAEQKKYDAMLQLQPIVVKIETFERRESTTMRQDIEQATTNLKDLQKELKRLKDSMVQPENFLTMCKDMVGDMALWDRYNDEVEEINMSVIELQYQLQNAGLNTDRTMQEAETEQNQLQQNLKETRNAIKNLQSTLDSRNEKLRRCDKKRTELLEKQLRIHKEMQDIKQAKETLAVLLSNEKTKSETILKQKERLVKANNELDVASKNLERVKQEFRLQQESDRKVIQEHKEDLYKLRTIQSAVNQFGSLNISGKLKSTEEQLRSAERTSAKYKNERTDRETKLSKIRENILFHGTAKRDLEDNLELLRNEIKVEKLKTAADELQKKLNAADWTTLSTERTKLGELRDSKEQERNIARGAEQELENNIADLTLQLQTSEYHLARKNFRDKCAELTICQKVWDDLFTYSRVLDAAMIEYHEERMSTVNKIMKKLWDLIYTGSDTSSIQIRTEATTAKVDKKRQFNYKLVQVKHGVEIDMKGRCSAGQKVLASIILRLALAETFCEKCGVLALDEPTTNLDEENAKSLADALHKYVSLRKMQRNFQLIIITHDENFIPQLGQLSSNNSYYELFRHRNGLSGIKKVSLDGLLSRNADEDSSDDENKDSAQTVSKRSRNGSSGRPETGEKRPRKKAVFE